MNIASYLGAATVRIETVGYENREATEEEKLKMEAIVAKQWKKERLVLGHR